MIAYREDEADWTPWRSNTYRVRVHVQDLTENIIDRSHFSAVHDMAPPEQEHFEVSFRGPSMVVEQSLKVTAVSEAGFEVSTTTTTCGPGIVAVEVNQDPIEMLTYITQTPIDEEFTEVSLLFSMKRLADADRRPSRSPSSTTGSPTCSSPRTCRSGRTRSTASARCVTKVDGPVVQYRRWFRQFYSDDSGLHRD